MSASAQHYARRIPARRAHHTAARMRCRSAKVKPANRHCVSGVAGHRAKGEELVERHRTLKNASAGQTKFLLEIERREDLPVDHRCFETRRVTLDNVEATVGILVAKRVGPGSRFELVGR